jgi:hypothetical protein
MSCGGGVAVPEGVGAVQAAFCAINASITVLHRLGKRIATRQSAGLLERCASRWRSVENSQSSKAPDCPSSPTRPRDQAREHRRW